MPAHLLEPGRALSRYDEGGLGSLVRAGKYDDGRFDDALVAAAARFVQRWRPEPSPTWVAAIPDRDPNGLVVHFAQQLANRLDLEFVNAVRRVTDGPPQTQMENSTMQASNALGSFAVGGIRPDPVLLVDDIIDSGWTMTVVGNLMLQMGSGPVVPFALAYAGTAH